MKSLISVQDLSYTIPYSDTILENISFDIAPGEFLGILGHNGMGKTTLLDILMGFKKGDGRIEVLDEHPHAENRKNKQDIVFLSQDITLKGNLTIAEFLKFHSVFYDKYSIQEEAHLLQAFNLKLDMKIGGLSTGQQKKVQIIAGLSSSPKIIFIDEITAVLDPETREVFFNELERVRLKNSCAIILATNIAEDLINRVQRILFISNKKGTMHDPKDIGLIFNLGKAA